MRVWVAAVVLVGGCYLNDDAPPTKWCLLDAIDVDAEDAGPKNDAYSHLPRCQIEPVVIVSHSDD